MNVKIFCNCGKQHNSFEEWQACPLALAPRPPQTDNRTLYGTQKDDK